MSIADQTPMTNAGAQVRAAVGTRVDAAHEQRAEAATLAEASVEAVSAARAAEQMRHQAAQLAAHLKRQQADVDHREAELNARLADMENQLRGARLWLGERHLELAQQKTDLERREKELSQRRSPPKSQPKLPDPASGRDAQQNQELADRKAELDRRQQELDTLAGRLAGRLDKVEQIDHLHDQVQAIDERRQRLERSEQLLAIEHSELDRARKMHDEQCAKFAEQVELGRHALSQETQQAQTGLDRARRDIERQADELATRQDSLERMRTDVARAQADALELRLATEELWARLCGTMAPAALTQSLAQIRLQLAEEQRLAREELAAQKAELQTLSIDIAEQHSRLAAERAEVRSWVAQRQLHIEQQAGVLAAGQQRMDDERDSFKQQALDWQNERFGLQQELRRLLRQAPGSGAKSGMLSVPTTR